MIERRWCWWWAVSYVSYASHLHDPCQAFWFGWLDRCWCPARRISCRVGMALKTHDSHTHSLFCVTYYIYRCFVDTYHYAYLCQWKRLINMLSGFQEKPQITVCLRSYEYSKNNESFNDKIHYGTMILYLKYKKYRKTVYSLKKCFLMYANII